VVAALKTEFVMIFTPARRSALKQALL